MDRSKKEVRDALAQRLFIALLAGHDSSEIVAPYLADIRGGMIKDSFELADKFLAEAERRK